MRKKTLDSCHTGDEFLRYAQSHGANVECGKGSHFKVITERGMCVVPVHPGDMGKGLRIKIIKTLTLILTLTILAAFLIPIL